MSSDVVETKNRTLEETAALFDGHEDKDQITPTVLQVQKKDDMCDSLDEDEVAKV